MKVLSRVLPLILMGLSASAHADDGIQFFMRGTGGFSCGKYIEYRRQPNNQQQMDLVVQWVWGYVTAFNDRGFFDVKVGHAVRQVDTPDSPTVLLFLEQFCEKHPLGMVAEGVTAMIKNLGGAVVWNPAKE